MARISYEERRRRISQQQATDSPTDSAPAVEAAECGGDCDCSPQEE